MSYQDIAARTQQLRSIIAERGINAALDEDALELRRAGVDPEMELDLPPIPSAAEVEEHPELLSELVAPGLVEWFVRAVQHLCEQAPALEAELHRLVADRYHLVQRFPGGEPVLVQTFGSSDRALSSMFRAFDAQVMMNPNTAVSYLVVDSLTQQVLETAGDL